MKITFLGHACFAIETDCTLLITDPWFTKDGAFNKSWFQYPYNHHLRDEVLKRCRSKESYIYVSHGHLDHFDINFLSDAAKHTKSFIIPSYKSKKFSKHFVSAMGKDAYVEVEDGSVITIGDLRVTMFIDDSLINEDSAILVDDGKHRFLNLNDCKIHDRLHWIKSTFGNIDALSVQYSGASWHPHSYLYTPEQESSIANRKKMSKFRATKNAIEALGATTFIPSAGPAILLDPCLRGLAEKEITIFAEAGEIKDYLEKCNCPTKFLDMYPGTHIDLGSDEPHAISPSDTIAKIHKQSTKSEYLDWYNDQLKIDFSELNRPKRPLKDTFEAFGKTLSKRAAMAGLGNRVTQHLYIGIIETQKQVWKIDFVGGDVEKVESDKIIEPFYRVLYLAREVEALLAGTLRWEDLALTFRAVFERKPNDYNTYINAFLCVDEEKVDSIVSHFEGLNHCDERITVEVDGKAFEIDRFCPHEGADLKFGWASHGNWVCPRHSWEFDLENGGNCHQTTDSIHTKAVRPTRQ